ncbi:uncharacterized protein LOC143234129 isoform X5 [Tachypleus tridentatus]|uniref:uncharacterized protein LOC143234129 isoform X5 n=1 Tax=Tachypleus tridentatus TaxID=6853 RepID=UPI003FD48AC0
MFLLAQAQHGQVVKVLDTQSEDCEFKSPSHQTCLPFQLWGHYKSRWTKISLGSYGCLY